jgi:sec-independent protein translocase protein TatA
MRFNKIALLEYILVAMCAGGGCEYITIAYLSIQSVTGNVKAILMTILNIVPQLLISMPGFTEWIIILVLVLLLFGAKKIPGLAKGLGQATKEFKDAKQGKDDEKTDSKTDDK